MKCAVLKSPGQVVIEELPTPSAERGQVLVRVAACGVCTGTDLHLIDGHIVQSFPFDGLNGLFGHETSGVVEEVGPEVTEFVPGDRVSLLASGYQEFTTTTTDLCVHVPPEIPLGRAIAEPLAVVLNSIEHADVRDGQTVVVLGAGFMGLLIVQALQHGPQCTLVVSDLVDRRLDLAREFGAEVTLNATHDDVSKRVMELTSGRGADVVIEAAGSLVTLAQCGELIRPQGMIVLHGYYPQPVTVDLRPWHLKELTVINSHPATNQKYQRLMSKGLTWLTDGRLDLDRLITHEIDLDDLPGHIPVLRRPAEMIKTIVQVQQE